MSNIAISDYFEFVKDFPSFIRYQAGKIYCIPSQCSVKNLPLSLGVNFHFVISSFILCGKQRNRKEQKENG